MSKIKYKDFNFRQATLDIIDNANIIIREYLAQGFELTLRQVYYQFVSRELFPESWIDPLTGSKNSQKSYDKLGGIINDARLAGLIDWSAIVDRTRNVEKLAHWESPAGVIFAAEYSYRLDKWEGQEYRPQVWIEKDALRGVITGICEELDISHFSCRGYTSQSEMWRAGQEMIKQQDNGQIPFVIHLGDHDPSGIDMSRDIWERLEMFTYGVESQDFIVKRIALNFNQVQRYNPPPNFAKATDSRFNQYQAEFGEDCWELDALEPSVIVDLIRGEVEAIRDNDLYDEIVAKEQEQKEELKQVRVRYNEVVKWLAK